MEIKSNSNKDGIYINEVEGDIIGVGVSGSGNIIGKNITVYQQSIDSARVSYDVIEINKSNPTQSLQRLATYINLKLYEKDQEHIPYIHPNEYEKRKEIERLLLYGRSGSGKSRTMFEIIMDNVSRSDNIYVINPHNLVESVQEEASISSLVNKIGDNDIIIWDNFPDGFLQGEINFDHGLEILMAITRAKQIIVSVNPVKLEIYKKHLWKLYEHFALHEVIFDLQSLQNIIKSYGENISRFKVIYNELIDRHILEIAEILLKKEPTPLAVLHYYEKIFSTFTSNQLKTIDNNFAIQQAKELLIPSEYYAGQFIDVINDRPNDAEFLYVLKLCYDLGLESNIRRLEELQGEIFRSKVGDPTMDLSIWVYISNKDYYMYDIARNAIRYTDHQRFKIMNYLITKKFLSSIPNSSYNLLGLFIGEMLMSVMITISPPAAVW